MAGFTIAVDVASTYLFVRLALAPSQPAWVRVLAIALDVLTVVGFIARPRVLRRLNAQHAACWRALKQIQKLTLPTPEGSVDEKVGFATGVLAMREKVGEIVKEETDRAYDDLKESLD